ncbi:MAG: 1-deoxy-D-xylulose-5-phosphate reductoisomerase [Clostridia bacterium]|nr:1-deoxy-D-xylulose-5-phosphate reductoisomerase [Clostridia bacterium]
MVDLNIKQRTIKKAMVLGSTGSVGTQTLDVVRELGLDVTFLAAGRNVRLLAEQIREFRPHTVSVADEATAVKLRETMGNDTPEIICTPDELLDAVRTIDADIIFHSIGGLEGTAAAFAAAESGKRVAMANKEAIIAAGDLIFDRIRASGGDFIPVDSEHSAVFRCLEGRASAANLKKVLLTASGGPFFGRTADELRSVTPEEALAHPTWKMGPKITIDSATLMNKGFEIIEAVRLFGVPEDRVDVVVHRQSIIHSMVEYTDNTVIAQLSYPDMRDCIRYAATAPYTANVVSQGLDFAKLATLTFAAPDPEAYPLLDAARQSVRIGGTAPVSLIAADEEAVAAFLAKKTGFTEISSLVLETLGRVDVSYEISEESISEAARQAREICGNLIKR